jgi:AcrR family transcriptional regulator
MLRLMPRWEPDAYGRLQQAALDLFEERGFEATSVVEIAERAGLTKRTFFHHFADKREVLFSGAENLEQIVVTEILAQSPSVAPLDAAAAGFKTAANTMFEHRRAAATRRGRIIAASLELQERNMVKRATLADTVAAALQDREVPQPAATLIAWTAVTIFYVAFACWTSPTNHKPLEELIDQVLDEFHGATALTIPS